MYRYYAAVDWAHRYNGKRYTILLHNMYTLYISNLLYCSMYIVYMYIFTVYFLPYVIRVRTCHIIHILYYLHLMLSYTVIYIYTKLHICTVWRMRLKKLYIGAATSASARSTWPRSSPY